MVICSPGQMELNSSIFWLLLANTSKCSFHTTEQIDFQFFQWCTKLNHAVLMYFFRATQSYYGWWFYFLVNNAVMLLLSCRVFLRDWCPRMQLKSSLCWSALSAACKCGVFCIFCIFCILSGCIFCIFIVLFICRLKKDNKTFKDVPLFSIGMLYWTA